MKLWYNRVSNANAPMMHSTSRRDLTNVRVNYKWLPLVYLRNAVPNATNISLPLMSFIIRIVHLKTGYIIGARLAIVTRKLKKFYLMVLNAVLNAKRCYLEPVNISLLIHELSKTDFTVDVKSALT